MFAAISINCYPKRIEGQPANSRTDPDGFADGPGGAALDELAALRFFRVEFAGIRRKRSAATKTTCSKPFAIRCVARSSVKHERGDAPQSAFQFITFDWRQSPCELLPLYACLFTPAASEADPPAKVKAIAFRGASLLQRTTCLLAYQARTAPRTINPTARKRVLNASSDAKSSRT